LKSVLFVLGAAVFTVISTVMLIGGVTTDPPNWLGAVIGVLGLLLFGLGGVVYLVRMLGGRPMLVLDERGAHIYPPWPRSASNGVALAWGDLSAVVAWTQRVSRGARVHHLSFVPYDTDTAGLGEYLGQALSGRGGGYLRYAVQITPGFSVSLDEVASVVAVHRPDVAVTDQRD